MRLIFPGTAQAIRIRPEHLPGLKPPTAAPHIRLPKKPESDPGENIDRIYKRFQAQGGSSKSRKHKKNRGFDF